MNICRKLTVGGLVISTALVFIGKTTHAQTNIGSGVPAPVSASLAGMPGASEVISYILTTPPPSQPPANVPTVTPSPPGTYFLLQGNLPPSPFPPFGLPYYAINSSSSNQTYIVDDRGLDFSTFCQSGQGQSNDWSTNCPVISPLDFTNSVLLWLEVPQDAMNGTNLNIIVHNTSEGQAYTLLTKQALTDASWVEEELFYGTNGDSTSVQLPIDGRTNVFVWARSGTPGADGQLAIVSQPLDQEVLVYDTVTFSVATSGNGPLTYQWTCDGNSIPNATNSSYTISGVQYSDMAGYAVAISNGVTSVMSQTAQLVVDDQTGDVMMMVIRGNRQDYSFKNGVTYYIDSPVELYGTTVLPGGCVIKFDPTANSSLVIKGALICDTQPYYPAVLTSFNDDSQGEPLSGGIPQTASNAMPYLNLDAATSATLSNLRFCYADQAVTTPVMPGALDVWDCQFVQCHYGIVNLVPTFGATNFLHNVLFARCGAAIGASTNSIQILAEHVTADVVDFWVATATPFKIGLTNSIIKGSFNNAAITVTPNSAINPPGDVFQRSEQGHYYLAPGTSMHGYGTTNINPALLVQFTRKTTSPPATLPDDVNISNNMILCPQVPRYATGQPDIGYWYDAIDYTMAGLLVTGGTVTIEPGTAIALRNVYKPQEDEYSDVGCRLYGASTLISHGTPTQPNIFTAVKQVQEKPDTAFWEFNDYWYLRFGSILFIPDFDPGYDTDAPTLDFRFCNFYLPPNDYHIWSGLQDFPNFDGSDREASLDSVVYLTMQDCALHGGRIVLGGPDASGYYPLDSYYGPAAVTLANNLFDHTSFYLDPTFYVYGDGVNVDMALQAYNNLFLKSFWIELGPVASSEGNWIFTDNLFDKVDFLQNMALPLDFTCNAYWPKQSSELYWPWEDAAQLQPTTTGDGFVDSTSEPDFTAAPPYQSGPFGDYYMPSTTILHQAGSLPADLLGLCQYTTQTNQTKEVAGQTADIGLHYVAASNTAAGWVPNDADGDGLPDYVEDANGDGQVEGNETDPHNPMTDGVTPDPSNYLYATVDLAGDGLTGAIKQWLGLSPLMHNNPMQFPASSWPSIVSNTVQFQFSINSGVDTNAGVIILTVDGVTMNSTVYETNGQWIAQWDSTEISNGVHQLNFEVQLQGDDNSTVVGSTLVNVQNVISFPNFLPIAGNAIYVEPQTIYTNGTWAMDVYDDQSNLFASLQGQVDANGACDDPVTLQPGITVDTVDGQGNPLTSAYYTIELAVYPGGAQPDLPGGGGASPAQATKHFGTDAGNAWFSYPGEWIVTYQPLFAPGSAPDATISGYLGNIISDIAGSATWDNNSIIGSPLTAGANVPFLLGNNQHQGWSMPPYNGSVRWNMLATNYLPSHTTRQDARNLYYFGHFNDDCLGGTTNQGWGISRQRLQGNILLNGSTMPYELNHHPYRFVFIDGCNSAKGDLCLAFGIPAVQATVLEMKTAGLQQRAFVGWKNYKVAVIGNNGGTAYNPEHFQYIGQFFYLWSQGTIDGHAFSLTDALRNADNGGTIFDGSFKPTTTYFNDIQIYGATDLLFKQ